MFIDLTPLKRRRDFRLLFFGQLISDLGSSLTYVALPYQIFQITHSSLAVGLIGIAQLIPLLVTALMGGALADAVNRKALLICSELGLAICSLLLALSVAGMSKSIILIYLLAGIISALKGIHRPALEALTPRLVPKEELLATSALSSLRGNIGRVGGPAIAGLCISFFGLPITYALDAATFLLSVCAINSIRNVPQAKTETVDFRSIVEGLRYAASHQELMGTYLIDIIAMIFGMPMALFPAIAESFGGALVLGWLYTAPEVGALLSTMLSGWTKKVKRHGMAVVFAAAVWGAAIVAFGLSSHLYLALFFLAIAGAADMVSGLFRMTIWNETIPDRMRGRMAGIEMVSYMSGPLLGNAEAGLVAARFGVTASVVSGGFLCLVGVLGCGFLLSKFWQYKTTS